MDVSERRTVKEEHGDVLSAENFLVEKELL